MRWRQVTITVLQWVWPIGLFCACYVGITAFFNRLFGWHAPLWTGAVTALLFFPATLLLMYAERRGWIKGFLSNRLESERRKRELADAREKVLAEAKGTPRK